jgi:DNA-binding response OmpR family regulator
MNTDVNLNRKKVLLVEDEPLVAKSIKMLLEHDGFSVEWHAEAEPALTSFELSPHDLVITDHSLSGMNGVDFAARIKSIAPEKPIILATAHLYQLDDANHPGNVVDRILNKPFTLVELRSAILAIMAGLDSESLQDPRLNQNFKNENRPENL